MTAIDVDIKAKVQDKISFDPGLSSKNIQITVENGIVMLSGTVRSFYEKILAEQATKSIIGVKGVVEELRVDLTASAQRSDSEIAEAAVRALEWDSNLPENSIQVVVENGCVRLYGEVELSTQREEAARDIQKLFGVKSVINDITLKPSVRPQAVKDQILQEFQRNAILDASHVEVESEGGKVILKGSVRSWAEYNEAKKAAYTVPGVIEVESRLVIDYT